MEKALKEIDRLLAGYDGDSLIRVSTLKDHLTDIKVMLLAELPTQRHENYERYDMADDALYLNDKSGRK